MNIWSVGKFTTLNWCVSDNEYFDFAISGSLSSFYLRLANSHIGINLAKLNMKEFKYQIDRLVRKKARKPSYKKHKDDVLKNTKSLYNGINIILDAFEKQVFMAIHHPDIETHSKSSKTDDEDVSNFEAPREVTPRSVTTDFNLDRLYEDRDEDEQPDTTDMPELESDQQGKDLRILTPNQMVSRLPISLAQLKQEIIQKNLKIKSDNHCILCTDQKNL